MIISRR